MTANPLTRRRFIRICAIAGGLCLRGRPVVARTAKMAPILWRGTALGALASIESYGLDRASAENMFASATRELERLERVFSLYRNDSAITRLNQDGRLERPPLDLVSLLSMSLAYARVTEGAFDVTVQPLWELYRQHFSIQDADPAGPGEARIKEVLSRIGHDKISVESDLITLAEGSSVTLNGIAQGYITDRVVELLRAQGVTHTLVDLGEIRAVGLGPEGRRWRIGLESPERPGEIARLVEIADQAVATSGGYGFRFDAAGRFTHLFDPKTGRSPHIYSSVSVIMPTAMPADALSTAFSSMSAESVQDVLTSLGEGQAFLTFTDGRHVIARPNGTGAPPPYGGNPGLPSGLPPD